MLEYLICRNILLSRVEMTPEEIVSLENRLRLLEDEFVVEYRLPA